MSITRTPLVDDDGSGTTGTILNNAWQNRLYDQIDAALPGGGGSAVWQNIAFNAGHYSTPTAGATWVATGSSYAYAIIGKVIVVSLVINGTSTATGAPARFQVLLPFPPNTSWQFATPFSYFNNGSGHGLCFVTFDGKLDFLRDAVGTPFGAGVTSLFIQAMYALP